MKKLLLMMLAGTVCSVGMSAEDALVVARESILFDQPSAKGYRTRTADNSDLVVSPGMVFRFTPSSSGWNKVEYISGIHAFLSSDAATMSAEIPEVAPAEYSVRNTAGKVSISHTDNGNYTLTSEKGSFAGKKYGNALLFIDVTGNVVYSAATLNGETYVYDYSITGW